MESEGVSSTSAGVVRPSRYRLLVAVGLVVAAALPSAPPAQAASDLLVRAATLTNANGVAGDGTGYSVAVSADGSTMVVGVPDANNRQGVAYLYTRGSNGWQTANQPDVLTASDGAADDQFGSSVSVSQDGSVVAVGAPYAAAGGDENGRAYVFNRPGGGWTAQSTQTQTTEAAGPGEFDFLGMSVALSPDGTYVAAGAAAYTSSESGQGGVFVWSYNGSTLGTLGTEPLVASDAGNEDRLGSSLAMPSDSLIYAGAPYHSGGTGPRGRLRLLIGEQHRSRLQPVEPCVAGRVHRQREQPARVLGGRRRGDPRGRCA